MSITFIKYIITEGYSPQEAELIASQMIGSRLITKQTGSHGRPCNKVIIIVL